MKKFLLLRDNKQTGPYSFDDIKALGLKPYDLVWVDGRSAAWRYPGEIDELKSFAPPVEEQPYDRFYKKTNTEKAGSRNTSDQETKEINVDYKPRIVAADDNAISKETEKQNISPLRNSQEQVPLPHTPDNNGQESEKEIKRPKYVSVSMPSNLQKAAATVTNKQAEPNPTSKPIVDKSVPQKPVAKETRIIFDPEPREKPPVYPVNSVSQVTHPVQKNLLQIIAVAAGVISLVAVGILIGMGIGKDRLQDPKIAIQQPSSVTEATEQTNTPVDIIPQTVANVQNDTINQSLTKEPKAKVKKNLPKPVAIETVPEPLPVDKATENKVLEDNAKIAEAKEAARQNLAKSVSVHTNDYKVGMFGGIDDVKVTVNNNSEYPIDLVVVDVTYIQSNKKSYKTESLHFKDLAANSSITLDAPKANKGIKVKTSLTYITSKSLGISENIW